MLNSAAAGRRLALRVVAMQAVATLLTAGACLTIGPRAALAALAGVALGQSTTELPLVLLMLASSVASILTALPVARNA